MSTCRQTTVREVQENEMQNNVLLPYRNMIAKHKANATKAFSKTLGLIV